jgi:D-arginine dehydrogenase
MSAPTADVVVVGAGMGGASVAAELAREHSVVLLEAEDAGDRHSTGRSAASYLPSYGGPVVRALTLASRPFYDEIGDRLGRPLLTPRPLLWVATDDASEQALGRATATNPQLRVVAPGDAVALCPALERGRLRTAAVDDSAMDIDVAALHAHYLAAVAGSLHRRAAVRSIVRVGDGWRVETSSGVAFSCATVVDAAGAWADTVAAAAGVPLLGLRPKRRTVFVSPHRFADSAHWPIVLDALERWYFKPEAGGTLLVSPADETDVGPSDVRPDDLAIARTLDTLGELTSLELRTVRRSWAGLRSFVADRGPVLGSWAGEPGFAFVAGQGGYGIQMAPALAVLGADLAVGDDCGPRSAGFGVDPVAVRPDRLRPGPDSP